LICFVACKFKYTNKPDGYIMVLTDDLNMSFSAFQNFLNDPNRPGPSLGMPRTMDFQDRNFNGIDDRDEPGGSHYNPNNPKKPIGSKPNNPNNPKKPIGSKPKPKAETKPKAKPSSKPSKEELARRATREKKLHNKMKDF
jgi:hypothetical protein